MLEKWDSLVAVLGCVAIVAAISCVAHYGRELSAAQAPPAPDERRGGSAPPSEGMSGGGLDDGRDAFLLTLARDSDVIAHGEEQYRMFCAACHGEGDIGDDSPSNLFNNRWFHGSAPTAIEHLIREGFLDAGMPGWDGMIPDESIEAMVAYLLASQEEA
ncbi:MAG: cytochrome c [Opitutales bacterium]|nr:cytochrome c [Opitutales bacterium]